MEPNSASALAVERTATVSSMDAHRRARKSVQRARRRANALPPVPVIALWFGAAIFAGLIVLGIGVTAALAHGLLGVGIMLGACVAIGWPLGARWLKAARAQQAAGGPARATPQLPRIRR
jgi:hypothetical protein